MIMVEHCQILERAVWVEGKARLTEGEIGV
jgi:hypothetical protein